MDNFSRYAGWVEWKTPPFSGGVLKIRALWRHAQVQGPTRTYEIENTTDTPNRQGGFEYTDDALLLLDKFTSIERLAAYSEQARGDRWVAIHLYERNTELSEALYGVIQGLEITLRNAINNVLTSGLGSTDWYDKFAFQESERDSIYEAKAQIVERPAEITPGKVIAELTFAFWARLTAHNYEDSLWFPHIRRIFPIRIRRKQVHDRLMHLKTLRNRIAHHERILYKRDLEKDYSELLETTGWISPEVRDWIAHTNCFPERFATRIPKKQKEGQTKNPEKTILAQKL